MSGTDLHNAMLIKRPPSKRVPSFGFLLLRTTAVCGCMEVTSRTLALRGLTLIATDIFSLVDPPASDPPICCFVPPLPRRLRLFARSLQLGDETTAAGNPCSSPGATRRRLGTFGLRTQISVHNRRIFAVQ